MPVRSSLRAITRVLAACCLVSVASGGVAAQSPAPVQLAALTPAPAPFQAAPADIGPFGLIAVHSGAMAARWRSLQPALRLEVRMLDLCRSDTRACTPAAARFLAIVEAARDRSGRARVGEINRAVNLAIRPVSDLVQFQTPDVWTTPLMTFASGAGDCEDYAIAKYVALREAGMDPRDLRLTIVHDRTNNQDHAVTAARVDGHWLILDNRHMALLTDAQAGNLAPLVALDDGDANERDVAPARLVAEAT